MRLISFICCFMIVIGTNSSSHVVADEVDSDSLVCQLIDLGQQPSSRSAFLELCRALRSDDPVTVQTTQTALVQKLASVNDAASIRRISRVLSVSPCDEAIILMMDKLIPGVQPQIQEAACYALSHLLANQQIVDENICSEALGYLELILRDDQQPQGLIDSATMASASLDSRGFDLLIKLQNEALIRHKILNVFYVALSETGDPRALPVLREALIDDQMRQGARIQAVFAIGHYFSRATTKGQVIEPGEREACTIALRQYLDDNIPDQLFSVALQALGKIERLNFDNHIYQATIEALHSNSNERRQAALTVLYWNDCSLLDNENILDAVRTIAEADDNPSVLIAKAILEKCDVHVESH